MYVYCINIVSHKLLEWIDTHTYVHTAVRAEKDTMLLYPLLLTHVVQLCCTSVVMLIDQYCKSSSYFTKYKRLNQFDNIFIGSCPVTGDISGP